MEYTLEVETSGVHESPGTDATVTIQLFGEDARWPAIGEYDGSVDGRFEAGSVDTLTLISQIDLGNLKWMRVSHDNTGSKPGWFLNKITVTANNDGGGVWEFRAYRWLADDEADGETAVALAPYVPHR